MKRLEALLSLIEDCQSIVDIGSDHGYLAKMIVDRNLARKVYVTDVAQAPLLVAKENLKDYPVSFFLMDGLRGFTEPLELAVIAGMGGELIVKIIDESREIFENLRYFIVQPMQQIGYLRKALYERGFYLEKELLAFEDKYYEILLYKKGQDQAYDFNLSKGLYEDLELYKGYLKVKKGKLEYIKSATFNRDQAKYERTLQELDELSFHCRSLEIML